MIVRKLSSASSFLKFGCSILLIVSSISLAGVAQAQQMSTTAEGAIGGGLLGAGTGAIVGAAVHHPVKGALIGAGVGAVGGGLVGNQLEQREVAEHRLQSQVRAQQAQLERQREEIEELKQSSESNSTAASNQVNQPSKPLSNQMSSQVPEQETE